jgi:hypothetical protein
MVPIWPIRNRYAAESLANFCKPRFTDLAFFGINYLNPILIPLTAPLTRRRCYPSQTSDGDQSRCYTALPAGKQHSRRPPYDLIMSQREATR